MATKLKKKDIERFKAILLERRAHLLKQAKTTYERGLTVQAEELPDEVDLASAEADQSMDLLLRDRERILLRKIDKALKKFETNEYGVCEECGEMISVQRLEARPVAEYCIHCKEDMEQMEKSYAD
jgi:DnaK suppressor protein